MAEAAAEATETEAAAEATETAEAAEATGKAEAAMPGEPETAGANPSVTHSNTRQGFPCFSPAAVKQFTCHFFLSMHLTFCLLMFMFKRPSFGHHLHGYVCTMQSGPPLWLINNRRIQ